MMNASNPFGATTATVAAGAANPFAPAYGGSPPQQPPHQQRQQQWVQPQQTYQSSDAGSVVSSMSNNPYAVQQPNYGGEYYNGGSSNPYAQTAPSVTSNNNNNAMVVSTAQTNPYAMNPPYAHNQQPVNPWGQPSPSPQQVNGESPAAAYNPFSAAPSVPPNPYSAPSQAMEPYKPRHMVEHQPQQLQQLQPQQLQDEAPATDPFFDPPTPTPPTPAPAPPKQAPERKPEPVKRKVSETTGPPPNTTESPPGTFYPPQYQIGQQKPDDNPDEEEPIERHKLHLDNPRNPYAQQIARQAPPGASPLPKAEMVRKRGFVLARISFRTIVMKKWKQAYWVQYGPHTMLWFRNQQDFDDWLNNPYHQQAERNFLIKLAVNFVHDLYKPNVRGYQVTQCRTKGYGNKMVRQFKLERWMDYGPTIAAAFGSYNPKEVDALRDAIVECMRNTPLSGGIRATGAVRQPNPPESQDRDRDYSDPHERRDEYRRSNGNRSSYDELPKDNHESDDEETNTEEAAPEEKDLLDVNNWDDVPMSEQHQQSNGDLLFGASATTPSGVSDYGAPQQQYGYSAPQQQQQQYQAFAYGGGFPQPAQQLPQSTAMVPVVGAPLSYPGAPSPSVLQQQQNPWMQQQPQQQMNLSQQQQQQSPQHSYTQPPPYGHQQPYYQQQQQNPFSSSASSGFPQQNNY